MNPIYRFKSGDGELQLKSDGRAFNLWEALGVFDDEAFPIVVDGEAIELDEALRRAAEILVHDPDRPVDAGASSEIVEKVKARCTAAGLSIE